MKKWTIGLLIVLFCLGGCKKEEPQEEIVDQEELTDRSDPHTYLASLKERPSKDDEIFIVANDGTFNEELLDGFMEKCEKGEDCDLLVARYTIEGDVIYGLLVYNGTYSLYTDNSRDHYKGADIEDEHRENLYEYIYQKEEEYGDGKGIEESRFVFLSDKELQSAEEVQSEFERMRNNEENDLVIVFGDFRRVK